MLDPKSPGVPLPILGRIRLAAIKNKQASRQNNKYIWDRAIPFLGARSKHILAWQLFGTSWDNSLCHDSCCIAMHWEKDMKCNISLHMACIFMCNFYETAPRTCPSLWETFSSSPGLSPLSLSFTHIFCLSGMSVSLSKTGLRARRSHRSSPKFACGHVVLFFKQGWHRGGGQIFSRDAHSMPKN